MTFEELGRLLTRRGLKTAEIQKMIGADHGKHKSV